MQKYLAVTPSEASAAAKYHVPFAHAAYRIGPGSTLLRQNPFRADGGLLLLHDRDAPPVDTPAALCAAVLRECRRWNFQGVVLDLSEPFRQDLADFAAQLSSGLGGRTLYLPESYRAEGAVTLVCTAVSGGTFHQYLREAAARRGGGRHLALDVQRLRMDFTLPARTGEGTPLTGQELRQLTEQLQPTVFFSQDLCARYFTYARYGQAHFVLFDDGETMERKVNLGESLGYAAAFFLWPEIRDIAGTLFRT